LTHYFAVLQVANLVIGALLVLLLLYVAVVSKSEGEARAASVAVTLLLLLPLPYLLVGILHFRYQNTVAAVLLVVTAVVTLLLVFPMRGKIRIADDTPRTRIDERDIMFSRRLLEVGSAKFEQYYRAHPEKKHLDDRFREKPGLLARGASGYHPYAFPAADASFWTIERLRPFVDGETASERVVADPGEITKFVKRWALKLGALSVGITQLQYYHLYAVVGRGEQYGEPVKLNHEFAIALTVEMDKAMLDRAPHSPTVMESAQQYLESGTIAVQLADFSRRLGYPARAHIDGNYRVVCPLVARDAGLGEIGRMGLLMTPQLGPRVRIAVVTTDLPLLADEPRRDETVVDFCTHCRKCAAVCPSRAISFDDRTEIDGTVRWQINSEACFTFWCQIGTDCARCMKVCPYSHPDNLLHNAVRRGVSNSALFRRVAIAVDDLFYGKKPVPASLPDWMTPQSATGEAGIE
jgi:ferredoxin